MRLPSTRMHASAAWWQGRLQKGPGVSSRQGRLRWTHALRARRRRRPLAPPPQPGTAAVMERNTQPMLPPTSQEATSASAFSVVKNSAVLALKVASAPGAASLMACSGVTTSLDVPPKYLLRGGRQGTRGRAGRGRAGRGAARVHAQERRSGRGARSAWECSRPAQARCCPRHSPQDVSVDVSKGADHRHPLQALWLQRQHTLRVAVVAGAEAGFSPHRSRPCGGAPRPGTTAPARPCPAAQPTSAFLSSTVPLAASSTAVSRCSCLPSTVSRRRSGNASWSTGLKWPCLREGGDSGHAGGAGVRDSPSRRRWRRKQCTAHQGARQVRAAHLTRAVSTRLAAVSSSSGVTSPGRMYWKSWQHMSVPARTASTLAARLSPFAMQGPSGSGTTIRLMAARCRRARERDQRQQAWRLAAAAAAATGPHRTSSMPQERTHTDAHSHTQAPGAPVQSVTT